MSCRFAVSSVRQNVLDLSLKDIRSLPKMSQLVSALAQRGRDLTQYGWLIDGILWFL